MRIRDDIPEDVRKEMESLLTVFQDRCTAIEIAVHINRLAHVSRAPEPCQPPIPWEYIDERWQWMAMDHDGEWFLFDSEPGRVGLLWESSYCMQALPCPRGCLTHDWKDTLIQRPQGERHEHH